MRKPKAEIRGAFTLIELLVVISIMSLLAGLLLPALNSARRQSRGVVCRSNLRQLAIANIGYSSENDGYFVPAASDMWNNSGLNRWHGVRNSLKEPFDPARGPLASFLGGGGIKECPERTNFIKGLDWSINFEQGCGGYGYNMTYLGSRLWCGGVVTLEDYYASYARTTSMAEVRNPSETLMFADCAMSNEAGTLIEYSFAEAPFYVFDGTPIRDFFMSPSIHFRHNRFANVAWADGHIDSRPMAKFDQKSAYSVMSWQMMLGWFEPIDNSLFDLH